MKMKLVFATICAAALLAAPQLASAAGKSGKSHASAKSNSAGLKGLDRADFVAGTHGLKGRDVARTRGSHAVDFCPPGQRKKAGYGSSFAC